MVSGTSIMRRFFRGLKNSELGIATVEVAIMLPIVLLLLLGTYHVSKYIRAVNKIDNVANDIAYLLSREGQLTATRSYGASNDDYGAAKLTAMTENVIPFLIYPYSFNSTDYRIKIQFIGLPIFASQSHYTPCTGAVANPGYDRYSLRIMWQMVGGGGIPLTTETQPPQITACTNSLCQKVCSLAGQEITLNSVYTDNFGQRVSLFSPGDSAILVDFAYKIPALFDTRAFNMAPFPTIIERASSYMTRPLWEDKIQSGQTAPDNVIQPSELTNYMHICGNCSPLSSINSATIGGAMKNTDIDSRQPCAAASQTAISVSSYCGF